MTHSEHDDGGAWRGLQSAAPHPRGVVDPASDASIAAMTTPIDPAPWATAPPLAASGLGGVGVNGLGPQVIDPPAPPSRAALVVPDAGVPEPAYGDAVFPPPAGSVVTPHPIAFDQPPAPAPAPGLAVPTAAAAGAMSAPSIAAVPDRASAMSARPPAPSASLTPLSVTPATPPIAETKGAPVVAVPQAVIADRRVEPVMSPAPTSVAAEPAAERAPHEGAPHVVAPRAGSTPGGAAGDDDPPFAFDLRPTVPVDDGRATRADVVSLPLAVLLPPIGLLYAGVRAGLSRSRRGFTPHIVGSSIVVGLVMSGVAVAGGGLAASVVEDQLQHDRVAEASAAFCSATEKDPTLLGPDLGWPKVEGTVDGSLETMAAFVSRWTALADAAPAQIRADAGRVADTGQGIVEQVSSSRTIRDTGNRQQFTSHPAAAPLRAWQQEYCR